MSVDFPCHFCYTWTIKGGANMLHIYQVSVTTNCGCLITILTRAETQEEAVENIFQLSMGIGRIESVRYIR